MNMEPVRTLMVADEGIVHRNLIHPDDLPSRAQVELCKVWLSKFSKKRQFPHGKRQNSYYLKDVVEEATGAYVTNGAFIQAALELEFRYATIDGPNAFFHIELLLPEDNWKRVKPRGFSKWLFKQHHLPLAFDAKEDQEWPRRAIRFIDFWRYLDRHNSMSERTADDLSEAWEQWTGKMSPRPDLIETDCVYDRECDFISYGKSYPHAPRDCTYLYALVETRAEPVKATTVEHIRVRYVGQTTSPTKRLRDHIHRPGSIDRVKWIGGLLNDNRSLEMAIFDTVAKSLANALEKAGIYAFSKCETRWDDQIEGFPPLDDALLNVDK